MKKHLMASIVFFGLSWAMMGIANAVPLPLCSTSHDPDLPCYATGNDHATDVNAAILAATGTSVDLQLYGKSDDNANLFTITADSENKSGTWLVKDGTLIDYLTVKASNEFAVYFIGGSSSGTWTTEGLFNNGDQQPALSHLSFWVGSSVPVPEPSGLLILGAGLLGLATLCRRARHRNR